ncbi:MAG: glycosyl hydrolase family 28-related protein [Fimbriimonas sp.]|nr:glycosyl hydrolase family 28-related protein [Fimbriimonas sp.]
MILVIAVVTIGQTSDMVMGILVAAFALSGGADLDVASFGAKGDGVADDTAAFQTTLDAASKQHVNVVARSGNYRFLGRVNVPDGVALKGSWESVPAHNGIRDPGLPKPTDGGTTFLVESGEGTEAGAFLTLNTNSTLKGVVVFYPKQSTDDVPTPYPYTIAMRGKNPAILDVELLNPYNGIDASDNERHLIRNIQGQPLRRGVFVDSIYDIGRIENVHFNPWFSMKPKLFKWQQEHGEAFIFGRADWEYVLNTFCFGYNVGYRFIESKTGACNGNFLGIGADDCYASVKVEQSAPFGLLITNGEFTAFHGPDPTMVVVSSTNSGVVRFSNCSFWGPCNQIADVAGSGTVGFNDCTFVQWDGQKLGRAAIHAIGGSILVRGCEFREDKDDIRIEKGVRRAIVSDCLPAKKLRLICADHSVLGAPR